MFSKSLLCAAIGATLSLNSVQAQVVPDVPLDIDGAFEGATATNVDFNTGGTIRCNSQSVIVPRNLQITFPAAFVSFKDFVANKAAYTGYQCSITGNVVNGKAIAAQIAIAQFATTSASGYVETLSYNGDIKIKDGPIIRINDPRGVYSTGYADKAYDPNFTADDANPSISSFSGFPMCVPRMKDDPKCPMDNRPDITPGIKQGSTLAKLPKVMAPLVPGDYVTYSGYESSDGKIIIYNLVAFNIQITTTGAPTYIRTEDANIGVWTADTANQEIAQTRFVGYTSDSSGNVNPIKIYAIDYDPCSGEPSYREIAGVSVPNTEVRNKFEYRLKATQNDQYTREYRIVAGTGIVSTTNGIMAGQYVMPVSEWIQPEDSTPGTAPTGHDFRSYSWLANGLGRDADGNLWGPLDPFPQGNPPALFDNSKCAPAAPATPPAGSPSPAVSPSPAASSSPAATPKVYPDVVTMPPYNWISSQSGTLTVQCTSNSTNDAAVNMKLSYSNKDGTTVGLAMTAAGKGVWNFNSNKIKQPTSVTCKSGLGGSATR